jgi:vitamin B12 transporter
MRNRLLPLSAILAVIALPQPASASGENAEIVVTATRGETERERLPADVEIIDTDGARERGALTLGDALAGTPGIQAPRTGPVGQQTSIFSGGFESNHTLVLFDGVRLDDPSTPEGLFDAGQDLLGDASRIEVVQGPMSALYGASALGGVINVLPRQARAGGFNPRMELIAGSFGTVSGSLSADGQGERFSYAVTADAFASDGYDVVPERIATHTGERDGADMTTLTGIFDLALTDAIAVDLLLRRRDASAEYDPGFFGNIGESDSAEIRQNDTALWRLGANWSAGAVTLRLSGGELATDRVFAEGGVDGDAFHGDRRFADALATITHNTWRFTTGASLEDETIDAVSFGLPIAESQQHAGAFAGAQGEFASFDLTAALRHDDFDSFGGATTWRAGISRRIANARIYAAYGTSYRAPSLYELHVPFFGAPNLQPEEAESWEFGASTRLGVFGRDDGLDIQALARSSEVRDLIGFFGFSYANVDQADIDFAELQATLRPTDWLAARLSYANTDARDAATGVALLRRPRHAWSAELEATNGPFSGQISWRQTGARLDVVYDDLGFYAGVGRVESYDVVRASAAWSLSQQVRFYVAADNLLDETYEPVNGFAGAPASFLVGLRITP